MDDDFTYVSSWRGFVYVALDHCSRTVAGGLEPVAPRRRPNKVSFIDTYADVRRGLGPSPSEARTGGASSATGSCLTVGWRASKSLQTRFVTGALEQALCERRPGGDLVHHSDRGSRSQARLSLRYTERLAEAGLEPSVAAIVAWTDGASSAAVGDSYDNALAKTIIGLFKAEVIHRLGPWKSADAVEWETLKWVDWFNRRRLLGPIGNIPPAEAERSFYEDSEHSNMLA